MLKSLREYISDNELKIIVFEDRVNICNYDRLRDITENEISFTKGKNKIKVFGKDLKLNKLLDNEVLILGIIKRVELNNE
ncbi:MAG: hypothetical protein IKO49_07490 [Bacilli bacterium]|nr:hypothetical protein [Bacilli bacterium]